MAEFLTTNGMADRLDGIISEAEKELVLASPFIQLNRNLFDRLKEADQRGIRITLIYGKEKDKLKPEERKRIETLKNLSLHFHHNLHAKCYYNEKRLVIGSMNLYDFSEKHNREMGVLVRREEDDGVYGAAVAEVRSILRSSEPIRAKGFCIRCSRTIELNQVRPYCPECFSIWDIYKNRDYVEQCCHECGDTAVSTIRQPFCTACSQREIAVLLR